MNKELEEIFSEASIQARKRVNERIESELEKRKIRDGILKKASRNTIPFMRALFAKAIIIYQETIRIERNVEQSCALIACKHLVPASGDNKIDRIIDEYNCHRGILEQVYFVAYEKKDGTKAKKPVKIRTDVARYSGAFTQVGWSSSMHGVDGITTYQNIRRLSEQAFKGELTDSFFDKKLIEMLKETYEMTLAKEKELNDFLDILKANTNLIYLELCKQLATRYMDQKSASDTNLRAAVYMSHERPVLDGELGKMAKLYENSSLVEVEPLCYCYLDRESVFDAIKNYRPQQYKPVLFSALNEMLMADPDKLGIIEVKKDVNRIIVTCNLQQFEQTLISVGQQPTTDSKPLII